MLYIWIVETLQAVVIYSRTSGIHPLWKWSSIGVYIHIVFMIFTVSEKYNLFP